MTMEVILSTAFGRAVDVQGGKGGKLFESAVAVFSELAPRKENEPTSVFKILQFLLCKCSHCYDLEYTYLNLRMLFCLFVNSIANLVQMIHTSVSPSIILLRSGLSIHRASSTTCRGSFRSWESNGLSSKVCFQDYCREKSGFKPQCCGEHLVTSYWIY